MGHYSRLAHLPSEQRIQEADSSTCDAFAPWYEGMPPEERTRLDEVTQFLDEILIEDFGLKKGETTALTPEEAKISQIGFAASKEFLAHSAHLVPPFPFEAGDIGEWEKRAQALALDVAPKDRLADTQWTKTFIQAFVGELFMYQRDRR